MSFGAIGGSLLTTAVGSAFSSGGGPGTPSQSSEQVNPFGISGGLFGGSGFGEDGSVNFNLDPQLAQLQGQGLNQSNQFGNLALNNAGSQGAFNLGQQFMGQLNETNPLALQNTLFQQQAGLLQPQFQQQQLDQEGRLFAQGRLGSTAGSNQQEALLNSQNNTFGQLLANAFQQSQGQQQQTAGLASMFSQLDPQLSGLFQSLGTGGLSNALNINQGNIDTLALGGDLNTSSSTIGALGPEANNPLSAGLITSGAGGIGKALGGLFQGGPVDFFGTPNQTQGPNTTVTKTRL